jgi:glycosyltransferase involved in cell wall biosynthesis
MKFLIILPYFNRPNLVKFAIKSVLSQSHGDWQMVLCDDGSDIHVQDVLDSMGIDDSRISIKRLNDTIHQKQSIGSRSGVMINEACVESDCDIAIILCDDDGLFPAYLDSLNKFYIENQSIYYSYGSVSLYDPEPFIDSSIMPDINLNSPLNHGHAVMPSCMVDASQVSWRLNNDTRSLFPSPQTTNLDEEVFRKLHNLYGLCVFNGTTAQYKGWFSDQMGNRMIDGSGIEPRIQ